MYRYELGDKIRGNKMDVSIIIPCYNYGKYLKEAIESALNQTVKCEVIVVDDGSTDNTKDVAKSFGDKITYLSHENTGLSFTRNKGIKESSGKYILCLDADDKIAEDFVEKCLEKFTDGVGIVRTWTKEFDESSSEMKYTEEVTPGTILVRNQMSTASMFLRKAWEEVGGYDENMKDGYEDWEFWIRVLGKGYSVATVNEFLFFYRKHGHSMIDDTNKKADKIIEYIRKKHPFKKKILFLESVLQNMSGVTYYRMVVPGKALSDKGYDVRFDAELLAIDESGKPSIVVDELEWADIIVTPRYFNFSPNVVVSVIDYAKSIGKKIIYETDDYLYQIPEHNPVAKIVNQPSTQMQLKYLEDSSNQKTVTTRKLQERLGGIICPNSIDMSMWEGIENNRDTGKLVIGWAGGWTHKKDLEMLIPVLKKLKKKYLFEIRLFGYDPDIPKHILNYKYFKWAPVMEYPKKLAEVGFDIGIAPLVDDEFNQYKSNIKWLEYAMLGVPIVASNLPPYEDIRDGVDGFLATTEDEWYEKLEKLIVDANMRREMGSRARERVINDYDIKKTISQWEKAFNE